MIYILAFSIFEDLDPNFEKLFKLIQFIIEFLLTIQKNLIAMQKIVNNKYTKVYEQTSNLDNLNKKFIIKYNSIKINNKKNIEILKIYHNLIRNSFFSGCFCIYCKKVIMIKYFNDSKELQIHIIRKHVNNLYMINKLNTQKNGNFFIRKKIGSIKENNLGYIIRKF